MAEKGEYRGVYVALVDSWDFQQLTPAARISLVVLKLKLGLAGIAPFVRETMPVYTGCAAEDCAAAWRELEAAGWIECERNIVWLRNGLRFDPSEPLKSPNQRKGVERHVATLPRIALVTKFLSYYGFANPCETLTEGFANPSEARKTEDGEQKTETEPPLVPPPGGSAKRERASRDRSAEPRGSRFVPATWEPSPEAWAFALERLTERIATRELAKFRNNEFKKALTKWDSAFRNWVLNAEEFHSEDIAKARGGGQGTSRAAQEAGAWQAKQAAEEEALRAERAWLREVGELYDSLADEEKARYVGRVLDMRPALNDEPEPMRGKMLRTGVLHLFGKDVDKPAPKREGGA